MNTYRISDNTLEKNGTPVCEPGSLIHLVTPEQEVTGFVEDLNEYVLVVIENDTSAHLITCDVLLDRLNSGFASITPIQGRKEQQ